MLLAVAALAAAQDSRGPGADRAAAQAARTTFESGLKAIQGAAVQGRFKPARDQLTELLRAHATADYVFARKVEIGELVKSCCFGIRFPEPSPKSLVSGELLSWDAQSGAIKIRYPANKMGDWEEGEVRYHPIRWKGPYSIEIKGGSYPGPSGDSIQIVVCACEDGAIAIIPGAAAENQGMTQQWLPARMVALKNGEDKAVLDKKEQPPCRGGKPYAIKVRVGDSGVVATYNGQALLNGGRGKVWGHAAFGGGNPDEVILEGRAEGSWIQGLVDQAREKNRAEFERTFVLGSELPEWLVSGKPAPKEQPATDAGPGWPDELGAGERQLAERLSAMLEKDDLVTGLRLLERMKPGELPVATKNLLLARFYEEADRLAEAEVVLDRLHAAAPAFWAGEVIRGRIFLRTGRGAQAADLFEKLVAAAPSDCTLAVEAAMASLMMGRTSKAKSIVDGAIARGLACSELEEANTLLVKAINGPAWPKRFEVQSQNFVVMSDIDKKTCEDASKLLEESYLAYSTWLERVPNSGTDRFKVYLFSGEAGYQAWTKDVIGEVPVHTAGVYSPVLKNLMIWNLPSREEMLRTVRHEGFHQYLDRLVPDPPVWFNEGLAEYFEVAKLEGGGWKAPEKHPYHAEFLANNSLVPLSEFLFESPGVFYRKAESRYAQAWAFVTFLRHSTPENKQLFQKLWSALRENVGAYAAVTKTFAPADMTRLDRELAAWVASKR
jgi:hypothetical protein